jgi:predicted AlkP superfamily pyrophosphatase or phosphodiesterase
MKLFLVVLATALFFQTPSAQQAPPSLRERPKLVVVLAVDQMRADYVDKYRGQWSKGLSRLVGQGAWFRQADYPYYITVTCAGHASISTGAPPSVHGMTANNWWESGATKNVACTADEKQKLVSYGAPLQSVGQSAARLMTTTLADELKLQSPHASRVVSVSLKARSAIALVGHTPDAVIWLDEETGEWATSTAFAKEPAPYFAAYARAHPVKDEVGRSWERALPKDRYLFEESMVGRQKTSLATTHFPHVVKGTSTVMDNTFTDAWESSPYSDVYLEALAESAIDGLKLGHGAGTDYLAISFSALDKVGHDFGPNSHEVQDVLIRLDQTLGRLLDKLDSDVGRANYVVALTADHGVSPVPEQVQAAGLDAGRLNTQKIGLDVDAVLQRELGPGSYRTRVVFSEVFFNEGVYDRLLNNPKAMNAVIQTIQAAPGVRRVYRQETLLAEQNEIDPLVHAAALSHFPGRNGELFMVSRAYWIASLSTVTHGTAHRYDTHVPVLLYGSGIKAGEYLQPASPLDIAPTLAFLSGVTLPDSTGRVLTEAIAPNSKSPNP